MHQEEAGDRIRPGSGTSSPRGPSAYMSRSSAAEGFFLVQEASERAPRAGEVSVEMTIIIFHAALLIFCC